MGTRTKPLARRDLALVNPLLTPRQGNLSFTPLKPGTTHACTDQRVIPHKTYLRENYMKRLALVAAVIVAAACSTAEKPTADTAAPAMAPAPAMDSTMTHDSATAAAAKMDTAAKKADTAAKKIEEAKGAIKDATKKP